tara:strand:+ start:641 stop:1048 length:408 start_codon:yes stop_codon:yes gene_type:complete
MGYRSEVHIAVPKRDEKKLDAIMNKHNFLQKNEYGDTIFTKEDYKQKYVKYNDDNDLIDERADYVIYRAYHLKWYEGYKEVDAVESFIRSKPYDCCNDEDPFGRVMVCIGEDNAIHSDIGDYHDVFNINMIVELQ